MVETKIITWINSRKADITKDGEMFSFVVKPFKIDYKTVQGEIRQIKFKENSKNINTYQGLAPDITQDSAWSNGRILIELDESKIRTEDNGQTLVIEGEIPSQKWDWNNDFRFTLTDWEDWGSIWDGQGYKLILHINERKVEENAFSPLIKGIIVRFKDEKERSEYKQKLEKGQKYSLDMTEKKLKDAKMILGDRLDLSNPATSSTPEIRKVDTNNQPIIQDKVEEQKVRDAYEKAQTAYNNRRTNLEAAIQALKELLKIGKEGTDAEKRKFAEITTKNELDLMKAELVHNSYEKGGSYPIPNFNELGDSPRPNQQNQNNETPTLWEKENVQESSIEKYNELYRGGKHSSLVKYNQLHSQIHNNFEQYKDKPLFKQIDEKEAFFKEFRDIWNADDKNKRLTIKNFNDAEMTKREEVTKLMERLIAENKGDSSKKRKHDEPSEEANKKPKTVSDLKSEAQNEVAKQDKKIENTLADFISEAKKVNTLAELERLLKEIDKYKGEKSYSEKESEITELKRRLIKMDSKKYQTSVSFDLKDKLEKNGIATSDLDSETQSLITKLEKETISEEEIISAEKKVSEAIGVKNALNKLEELIQELEKARKQKDNKKGEDKLQELVKFIESTNLYSQKAYAQQKSAVDKLLGGSYNNENSPNKDGGFPLVSVLALGGGALAIGLVGILVFRSRRKKKERLEI